MSEVMIRKADYQSLAPVIRDIFEKFPLDLADRKVFIKPNLVMAAPPEKAATTHPALLRAIAQEVERRGGTPWIGENGIDIQNLYRVTGVEEACGPYLVNISKAATLYEIGGFKVPVSRKFLEADLFINVPKLKTHMIAGMTCCLKNPFGLIPANAKSRVHAMTGHAKRLTEFFIDLYRWRIPDLNIVDGILAMEGDGPTGGTPKKVGRILAGRDGVAVDAVCARLIGFESPRAIKLIDTAVKKGLAGIDLDNPVIDGPFEVMQGFVHPSTYTANIPGKKSGFALSVEEYMEGWRELGGVRPTFDQARCNQCGDCPDACPTGSILQQIYPKINPDTCSSCFSCVEACPEKAFTVPLAELEQKRRRLGM
jgi:uncharacterized protein (DUF362 family)/ferredoxin